MLPRTALVLLAAVAVSGLSPALAQEGKVEQKTYVYKKTPQGDLEMVVSFPPGWKASDRRPAIVFFFGGGWKNGSVKQFETQTDYLAGRGMVAARADYRVLSRHKTTPDKCVEDGKSAVRWLRQNAAKLGIDPDRIAAGGGSAGGHVAAATFMIDLEPEGEDRSISSRPNLLVLFNPALTTTGPKAAKYISDGKMAERISPTGHMTGDVPPAVIFFGTDDDLIQTAERYLANAKKLKLEAELYTAADQKHGFFNRSPWKEATLYQADRFLARHGYLEGEPTIQPKAELKLAGRTP